MGLATSPIQIFEPDASARGRLDIGGTGEWVTTPPYGAGSEVVPVSFCDAARRPLALCGKVATISLASSTTYGFHVPETAWRRATV